MKFGIREFAFVALMLGLVAGSYAMVVRPHVLQREEKLAEIRSMEASLNDLRRETADINEIRRRIDEQQKTVDRFENRLAPGAELDTVVKDICQMAAANSLQSGMARTLKADQMGAYVVQPIQLSFSGDFNGFYSFLLQLEALPRITRVIQLKMEKIDGHDGEMRADVTLCLFLPADDASASADVN